MKQKIFSIAFISIIFFFFFAKMIVPDKSFSYNENRPLEEKPVLSMSNIINGTYMTKFENYISDQIVFRDDFVRFSTDIKLLLGQKEINGVYFSNNYFVEKFKESDIDNELLDKTTGFISSFLNNHSNAKIGIIPTAGGVIDGLYPKYSDNINQQELINKIYSNFKKGQTIDIYNNLKKHETEDIYYRTDHHWTSLGAYYGYEAIATDFGQKIITLDNYEKEVVDNKFLGTIQSKVNYDIGADTIYKYEPKFHFEYELILNQDYNTKTNSLYDYEKLNSKEKYAVFLGGNNAVTRIINKDINNKKILIIKDSYSHSLVPFLINNYSEVVLLDLRYYMGGVETFLKNEEFDDILILYNIKNLVEDRALIRLNK